MPLPVLERRGMHFDREAFDQALEHVAKISDPSRFGPLTSGVSVLTPDAAARALLVMALPEIDGGEAVALADLPLAGVTVQPVGDRAGALAPEDVAEHPLSAVVKGTLGDTIARRLRFGAAREDLLPHAIHPQVLEIIRGAPGEVWAILHFTYAKSGAQGAATFGRKGAVHPVIRNTAIAFSTVTEIGGVAYALTLARAEPEPEAIVTPPPPSAAAVRTETVH